MTMMDASATVSANPLADEDVAAILADVGRASQRQLERILLAALDRRPCGTLPFGDGYHLIDLKSDGLVAPGKSMCAVQRYQGPGPASLKRLVILEPVVSSSLCDETTEYSDEPLFVDEVVGHLWWRRLERRQVDTRRVANRSVSNERREERAVPRGAWTVSALFVGADNFFPNAPGHNSLGGDAFGPDGKHDFDGIPVYQGNDITIQISHSLNRPVPFRALLLCEPRSRKVSKEMIDLLRDAYDRDPAHAGPLARAVGQLLAATKIGVSK